MGVSGFTLQWPSEGGRITAPFSTSTGYVMIAAPAGAPIKSGGDGLVVAAGGDIVQVSSGLYTVIYSNLTNLKVQVGQTVAAGTLIGESAGPEGIRLIVLQVIDPTPVLPSQPTPSAQPSASPVPAAQPVASGQPAPTPATTSSGKLYVTAERNLNVRKNPVVDPNNILLTANAGDVLEVLEASDSALAKLGVKDQWVNIRTLGGIAGYSAGQYLKAYTGVVPTLAANPYGAANVTGMNLDKNNPLGHPSPDRLKGIGWIRVKFNVSYNPDNNSYGNQDINAAYNRVAPFIKPYAEAGIKVLMVFTHQLYGEGAGYNWDSIDTGGWNKLIPTFADYAKQVAQRFAGSNLVHAYQVWNEQDTPKGKGRAAVPISSKDYANMLTQTIRAIRSVDSKTPIITGGHVTGSDTGSQYARETLAAMPSDVRPDGIAAHPYGLGPDGHKFSNNGSLEYAIRKFTAVLPGKPIWFTEWGVLGFQGNMSVAGDVTTYASGFMNIIKSKYSGQVATAIWYAWADGMDDGYGLVDGSDRAKSPLYERFVAL